MSSILNTSKEEIRNRIIKRAQELWGIDKIYDFDPLVVLMMEVLSSELFQITNDVHDLENRIFDKISRILASDNLVAPLPAHAIVHVQPLEEQMRVKPSFHMFVKKKLGLSQGAVQEKTIEIDYSPLHTATLFKGRLRFMATPQSLFELFPNQKKLLSKTTVMSGEAHTFYLGVAYEGGDKDRAYRGLNFYFDWGNYQVNREIYALMALSKWSINGQPIKTYRDRFMEDHFAGVADDLFQRKHFLNILRQDIEAYYQHRFLTLDDQFEEGILAKQAALPEEIRKLHDARIWDKVEEGLDWIRVDVPASIDFRLLEELYVSINAFPVVNKRAVSSKNRLNVIRNIVPIKTEEMEQLLTVEQMMDKDGMPYSEIPYTTNLPSTAAGYYTIRHGSVERLDARSAKDMVDYLFELIRDEKAAFRHYNADFLNSILKDLDKNIALIQQKSKLTNAHVKELQNYIVVNPKNDTDLMFMTVWLTYAELANGIAVGSILQPRMGNYLTNEPILFLSSSTGGRSRLSRVDSVQAFKYGITTSEKIVTKNDILNFVRYNLGTKVKRVSLRPGVQMDTSLQRGFYKTLDIHVEADSQHGLRKEEWDELIEQTLTKLAVRSTIQANYRIKLDTVQYL